MKEETLERVSIRRGAHGRSIGAFVVLATVACLLLPVGCSETPPSPMVLHEDPAVAEVRYGVSPILEQVGTTLEATAEPGGVSTGVILDLADLDAAHLPDAVAASLGEYVSLLQRASGQLRGLQMVATDMAQLLGAGDLVDANKTLNTYGSAVANANDLLSEVEDSSRRLLSALRRERGLLSSTELNELERRLDAAILQYGILLDKFRIQLESSRAQYEESKHLDAPSLSMAVAQNAVWTDEVISVQGTLSHGSSPLSERDVQLVRDGSVIDTVATDASGGFAGEILPPTGFAGRCEVAVRFTPGEQDAGLLRGVTTPVEVVTVRFHSSSITWEHDSTWYPGLVTRVAGKVTSLGDTSGRSVSVLLGTDPLGHTVTAGDGTFDCSLLVPPDSEPGTETLSVFVEGMESARTAPVGVAGTVIVERLTPEIDLPSISLLVMPQLFSLERDGSRIDAGLSGIRLHGAVTSPLPQGPAAVLVEWAGRTVETVASGGTFEVDLPDVRSALAVGPQTLRVSIVPDEPWHDAARVERQIFVLNLYVLCAGLLLVVLVWVVVASRKRVGEMASVEPPYVAIPATEQPIFSATPVGRPTGDTPAHLIVAAYHGALRLVQRIIGLVQPAHMTVREYAAIVEKRSTPVSRAFWKLTGLVELALYGGGPTSAVEASRAEDFALDVRTSALAANGDTGEGIEP